MIVPTNMYVLTHLPWDGAFQRPQQLIAQFIAQFGTEVTVIEEPWWMRPGGRVQWAQDPLCLNPKVMRPVLYPQDGSIDAEVVHTPELTEQNVQCYRELLRKFLATKGGSYILWVYSPVAYWYLRDIFNPSVLVYDKMDDHEGFNDAPKKLIRKAEGDLLKNADVVFTGGHTMHNTVVSRRPKNKPIICYPSGVNVEHFARAINYKGELPADIANMPGPIIGYFGVLDERIDRKSLAYMATMRPDWQFVMIGPFAKVTKEDFPEAPNIHYLGQKSMEILPGYLSRFTVATVLFVMSKATINLSPTKTLEYFAARKPVVSAPISDVKIDCGEAVRFASTPEEWLLQVEACINHPSLTMVDSGEDIAIARQWFHTAFNMMKNLEAVVK